VPPAEAEPLRVRAPIVWGHCSVSTTFSTPLSSVTALRVEEMRTASSQATSVAAAQRVGISKVRRSIDV
jgi:hypothetical protein